MPRKKETRYGERQYYKAYVPKPGGGYQQVYGKTQEERDEKVRDLQKQWAKEAEDSAFPFVWQYVAEWYATASASMTPNARKAAAREINSNILPVIGHLRMHEVTSDDVKKVMAARAKYAKATQEKTRQIVRRIFADAEEAGKVPRDPARRLKTAGGRGPEKKEALTDAQQRTLLEAVKGLPVWLFCMIGLYSGLRREEICGLQWDCVDLDGKAPSIRVRRACRWRGNTSAEIEPVLKSSASWRTVPVPPELVDALRAARPSDDPRELAGRCVLVNAQGQPWTYATLRSAWDSVRARSTGSVKRSRKDPKTGEKVTVVIEKRLGDKVRNHNAVVSIDFAVSPHVLRHTYITRLILGGMDLKRVQYLAGHSDAKITLDIYTSLMGHQPEDLIDDVTEILTKK